MCQECSALRAQVDRLEHQLRRQARLLKLAGRIIKTQRQQLDAVQNYAAKVNRQAQDELSRHLPRGSWSLWRGRLEVARSVLRIVRRDWPQTFWEMLGRLSGW